MRKKIAIMSMLCLALTAQASGQSNEVDSFYTEPVITTDMLMQPLKPTYLRNVTEGAGWDRNWFLEVKGGTSAFLGTPVGCGDLFDRGNQTKEVRVDGIEISKKNLYLAEGQTAVISAQVYPFNANNQSYTFESSNESVVSVEDGFVTAKKAGNATIYVYSTEGGYNDSCNVLVTTAANNLELNQYNNLNMPPKELEPIYYDKTTQTNSPNAMKISERLPFQKQIESRSMGQNAIFVS